MRSESEQAEVGAIIVLGLLGLAVGIAIFAVAAALDKKRTAASVEITIAPEKPAEEEQPPADPADPSAGGSGQS